MKDTAIRTIIRHEKNRQKYTLQMIPSENYASSEVRYAVGSILMNKYSEGQPGRRYYQGMENVDKLEKLVEKRALDAFHLNKTKWHVNVQPYSGSPANAAVFFALLKPKDTIMAMYLSDGGHISHGWSFKGTPLSFAAKYHRVAFYHVNKETKMFDYKEIEKIALEKKPRIIVSGGTAYPRDINHKALGSIAKKVGAYYLADISHEAGLIAAGVLKSPFNYADVVMCTTHKTLRGPRGALIFARKNLMPAIDKAVFPGLQGGPHNHTIAGIGVALKETMTKSFVNYAKTVVKNAQTLASKLRDRHYDVVTGGTDKHLVLIDLRDRGLSGKIPAEALEMAGIVVNCNSVPFDTAPPLYPSGLRMGTPAITTRGVKPVHMKKIASWIDIVIEETRGYKLPSYNRAKFIQNAKNQLAKNNTIRNIRKQVRAFTKHLHLP